MKPLGWLGVFGTVILLACASGGGGARLANEGTPPTTAEAGAPAVPPAETTTTTGRVFTVGDRIETDRGNFLVVHSYDQPVKPDNDFAEPDPGNEFVVIDVEACAGPQEQEMPTANPFDWELQMPDNSRRTPTVPVREPSLSHTALPPNECVRGFVTFESPVGQRAAFVVVDGNRNPLKWKVP